jgi:hypothetical protein
MMLVPYFDEGRDLIDDYMEEFLLWKNHKMLKEEAEASLKSGLSDLEI